MSKVWSLAWAPLLSSLLLQQQASHSRGVPPEKGGFQILSCSLGCHRGPSGLTCGTTEIALDETIRVSFNHPVALASLNALSLQLVDLVSGHSVPSVTFLDAQDPRTLVFRPQMTFDSAGNPFFALLEGHAYLLRIPGQAQDPVGPYVTALDGRPNQKRLQCTLVASLGVVDPSPGRPTVTVTVQGSSGPIPAAGASGVLRSSPIQLDFDDLMNPATLVNPVTGSSSFLHVFFDPDGNVANRTDQVPVAGHYTIALDQIGITTRVLFLADGGLPAPGAGPGKVVLETSAQVADLAGNTLTNPGTTAFTTAAQ